MAVREARPGPPCTGPLPASCRSLAFPLPCATHYRPPRAAPLPSSQVLSPSSPSRPPVLALPRLLDFSIPTPVSLS